IKHTNRNRNWKGTESCRAGAALTDKIVAAMERRHIKWVPLVLAAIFFAYQYFSSEKFVNPETGRKSHVGLSTQEEAALGLQSYQQILAQAPTVDAGSEWDMVQRVAQRLVGATGDAGKDFEWRVSLVRSQQVNAFCLP